VQGTLSWQNLFFVKYVCDYMDIVKLVVWGVNCVTKIL